MVRTCSRFALSILAVLIYFTHIQAVVQQYEIGDRIDAVQDLKSSLVHAEVDIDKQILKLVEISQVYLNIHLDSCLKYMHLAAEKSEMAGYRGAYVGLQTGMSYVYLRKFEYAKALELLINARNITSTLDTSQISAVTKAYHGLDGRGVLQILRGNIDMGFSRIYGAIGDLETGLMYYDQATEHFQSSGKKSRMILHLVNGAEKKATLEQFIPAIEDLDEAIKLADSLDEKPDIYIYAHQFKGDLQLKLNQVEDAELNFEKALSLGQKADDHLYICESLNGLARIRLLQGRNAEAIEMADQVLALYKRPEFEQDLFTNVLPEAYSIMSEASANLGDHARALEASRQHGSVVAEKERKRRRAATSFHKTLIVDNMRIRNEADEQERLRNFRHKKMLWTGLIVLGLIGLLLVRLVRQKTKSNHILEQQREQLSSTLHKLQNTQTQLIHSEKMASLGELTAGIAHEIQNPLNFVNNFSDVSSELIDEAQDELRKNDPVEASSILSDLRQNLIKISHHGNRASSIVKGMLDHSRASSGEKTPIDINQLADEYLRLAYHGLRAKDKSFNAKFSTELDPDMPLVEVVAQDIGRVILNLINNAFYAVNKKAKNQTANSSYEPTVKVLTSQKDDHVQIRVQDNGQGMPPEVVEKIFQPFFTTKPTGEGTGLGLSLSYDIVTKGHGGSFAVDSEEGVGTMFVISIPLD